jgi:hypothetical protein
MKKEHQSRDAARYLRRGQLFNFDGVTAIETNKAARWERPFTTLNSEPKRCGLGLGNPSQLFNYYTNRNNCVCQLLSWALSPVAASVQLLYDSSTTILSQLIQIVNDFVAHIDVEARFRCINVHSAQLRGAHRLGEAQLVVPKIVRKHPQKRTTAYGP